MDEGLVEIARCRDSFQAQTIVASLRAAGIEATVAGDPFIPGRADAAPYWTVKPGPRVLVRAAEADEARELIVADLDNGGQGGVEGAVDLAQGRSTPVSQRLTVTILVIVLAVVVAVIILTVPFR